MLKRATLQLSGFLGDLQTRLLRGVGSTVGLGAGYSSRLELRFSIAAQEVMRKAALMRTQLSKLHQLLSQKLNRKPKALNPKQRKFLEHQWPGYRKRFGPACQLAHGLNLCSLEEELQGR